VQSSFDADARARLAGVRPKIAVALAPAIDAAYPQAWGAEVSVETADGRRLKAVRHDAKGDPENPVSAEELSIKAQALLVEGGTAGRDADRLVAAILALSEGAPVRDLGLFLRDSADRSTPRLARSA
jgi:2-methylcitrate dehydratase PrpD